MYRRVKDVEHPEEQMLSVFRELGVVVKDDYENLNKTAENRNIYQLVHPAWLVVNRMKAWQGSVGISNLRGIVSGHYICFSPTHSEDSRYLSWLLRSEAYRYAYLQLSRGVRIGQAEIDNDLIRQLPVLLPPPDEQREIADFLDSEAAQIDAMIEAQRSLANLLQERRGAVIDAALLSLDAEWCHLSHVSTLQTGVTLGGEPPADAAEYPYLRVANVQSWGVDLAEVKTILVSEADARRSTLRKGDVLMTEGGDRAALGRGCVWNGAIDPCLHQNHIFAIRPDSRVDPAYLVYVLESRVAREYFESTRRQTTNLSATNSTLVKQFRFPLPSLAEQRRVITILDRSAARIEAMLGAAVEAITLMRERRSALISSAATGRTDPRTGKTTAPEKLLESV